MIYRLSEPAEAFPNHLHEKRLKLNTNVAPVLGRYSYTWVR